MLDPQRLVHRDRAHLARISKDGGRNRLPVTFIWDGTAVWLLTPFGVLTLILKIPKDVQLADLLPE